MACSAILVLDLKGRVLLARDYRGDIPLKYADRFIAKVNELEDAGKLTPVIVDEGVTYLYVQVSDPNLCHAVPRLPSIGLEHQSIRHASDVRVITAHVLATRPVEDSTCRRITMPCL